MKNKIIFLLSIFILICFTIVLIISNKENNILSGIVEDNNTIIESTEDTEEYTEATEESNKEDIIHVGTSEYTVSEYGDMVAAAIEHQENSTKDTFNPKIDVDKVNTHDVNTEGEFVNMPKWLHDELVFHPDSTLNLSAYAVSVYLYGDDVIFEKSDKKQYYSFEDGSYTFVYKVNGVDKCFTFTNDDAIVYVYDLSDELLVVE